MSILTIDEDVVLDSRLLTADMEIATFSFIQDYIIPQYRKMLDYGFLREAFSIVCKFRAHIMLLTPRFFSLEISREPSRELFRQQNSALVSAIGSFLGHEKVPWKALWKAP